MGQSSFGYIVTELCNSQIAVQIGVNSQALPVHANTSTFQMWVKIIQQLTIVHK